MVQLTEFDNAMLDLEGPRTPQLITALILYEGSGSPGTGVDFHKIKDIFSSVLRKSAIFRRKVSDKGRGWDTPFWVEDANFDLDFHLRHIALPQPGTWRQLCNQVARLHANSMDMNRPLWEAYAIEEINAVEGLPKGSFALVLKCHHAAIDGVGVARLVELLNSPSPDGHADDGAIGTDDWTGEAEPTLRERLSAGFANSRRRQRKLIANIKEMAPKVLRASKEDKAEKKNAKSGPLRTLFNQPVSSRRTMGAYTVTLDQMKRVRKAVPGVTLNDVAIAVVSGAMRHYLIERGQTPPPGLLTAAPISVREDYEGDVLGNQVGSMVVELHTDIADPIDRLKAVNKSAEEAKRRTEALGKRAVLDISESISPQVIGLGIKALSIMANSQSAPIPNHTIVSNVPGPLEPRYLAGALLHSIMALGPLTDGLGVFHGLMSGGGRVPISFVACGDIISDPEFYEECIAMSWKELEDAALALAQAQDQPAPVARKKSSSARKTADAG